MEIEALRSENVNLHQRMRDKSSEILKSRKFNHHNRNSSPYDMNDDIITAQQSMHMGITP